MRTNVVPIGNSRGVRIPSAFLELCHIKREVDLEIKGQSIIISPFHKKPRSGWSQAFKEMHQRKEDQLLIDDQVDLDVGGWEW